MSKRLRFIGRGSKEKQVRFGRNCILVTDHPSPAEVTDVLGNRADIKTSACPPVGARVELHHPEGGVLTANVVARLRNGIAVTFNAGDRSARYALSALTNELRATELKAA